MALHDNLRRARQARGLTQSALAAQLGVSDRAVSRWETGAACPDVTLLPQLAMLLETSADALLGMDPLHIEAEILRTTEACTRQLREEDRLAALPPSLQEIALVRLENPDATLADLGKMLNPPIGKSGVNHRMRRLMAYLEEANT